jgi:uncharacterized protein YecE (DUF72 family)
VGRQFSTVEINGSFYSLQRPERYPAWYAATPANFVFSVKGGRFITHVLRLRNAEQGLANFFASGILELGEKLGPVLWQLPPTFAFDESRLRDFLARLPKSFEAAARLARQHEAWMAERASFGIRQDRPIQHVLEVRHRSFLSREFIELLSHYDVAPCVADSSGLYPIIEDLCASFVYVRLHGAERLLHQRIFRRSVEVLGEADPRVVTWKTSAFGATRG